MSKPLDVLFNPLLQLLYPTLCENCEQPIATRQQILCAYCLQQLPLTHFNTLHNNPVLNIFAGRLPIQYATALCYFSKESMLQHLLMQLKYKNNPKIGFMLGRQLGYSLKSSPLFQDIDVLVPLPLHPKKEKLRGYNQATIISKGITSVWNKPILEHTVKRGKFTRSQTKQNRLLRWQNMENVFYLPEPSGLSNCHVLLIDDVITTGATLEACGQEILQANGARLSIATVAFTI